MSLVSYPRTDLVFRPRAERLEDREVPAFLASGQTGVFNPLGQPVGVDAPIEVIAIDRTGTRLLAQSEATNLVPNQLTPPGQTNLFFYDILAETWQLVARFKGPPNNPFANVTKGMPVTFSPAGGKLAAVLSGDGSKVAFLSPTNANNLDPTFSIESDGGGDDLFVWDSQTEVITLGSRTKYGGTIGTIGSVSNPFISVDGTDIGFVSTAPAFLVADRTVYNAGNGPTAKRPFLDPLIVPFGGFDVLYFDFANTPDLFRAVVGKTPDPVSYDTIAASYTKFDNKGKADTIFRTRAIMHGDLSVDPLNRYATAGVAGFVAMRSNLNGTRDVWRYGFEAGLAPFTEGENVLSPAGGVPAVATIGGFVPGAAGLGTVANAIASYESGDAMFAYRRFGPGGDLVSGYVNRNGESFDWYRIQGAAGLSNQVELVSGKAGSTNIGSDGLIDLDPRSIQYTSDGFRIVFVSTGTDHAAGISDKNRTFDVFQRDLRPSKEATIAISIVTGTNRTGNRASRIPHMTDDALVVAFESESTDMSLLVDANGTTDIFVRDRVANDTLLASAAFGNLSTANARSFQPFVTRQLPAQPTNTFFRRFQVFFASEATDLAEDATVTPGIAQVYREVFPIFISKLSRDFAFAGGNGFAGLARLDRRGNVINTQRFQPFPGWTGEVRVASADVTGDGLTDLIAGGGPGGGPRVVVMDGATGQPVYDFFAYEENFTGGVYVAGADLNGDGQAEIIVGAGEGGGPRVQVYDGATETLLLDDFAYEADARTGVRVSAGDFNGDGQQDLVVAAGIGGGPRVRVFDGTVLPGLSVLTDFFAYEDSQRGGVYINAGDFDGDGLADIVTGGGPDGGPRVTVFSAAHLQNRDPNIAERLIDFFAFDPESRDGARPVLRNLSGGKFAGLLVGTGGGFPVVRAFDGGQSTSEGTPIQTAEFIPFDEAGGFSGAWVG